MYDDYLRFLNNNFNKYIHSIVSEKYLSIFYNDLIVSNNEAENILKAKKYNLSIEKSNNIFKNTDSYYFPKEYEKLSQPFYFKFTYSFLVCKKKITLIFFSNNKDYKYIQICFKKVILWLHIVVKYGNFKCSKRLLIKIYLLDFKKILPDCESKVLDVVNVNSAYSSVCTEEGEIVLYRKEEWFKVFIHETFHAFGLDFNFNQNSLIKNKLLKLLNIDSKMYVFETYTEVWATILHISCICFELEKNISQYMFNNYFNYFLRIEQNHSILQSIKILHFMNLKYEDLIKNNKITMLKKHLYKEKTNIFNYYILKSICLCNINDFLNFCYNNNSNLLNFEPFNKNYLIFEKYLLSILKSEETKKIFNEGEKIYLNNKNNNFYFNKSLRMTIIDFF